MDQLVLVNTIDKLVIKSTGNYFESKEEAEKAVERLKKLQNLKNRGYNIDEYIDMVIERGEE